MKTIARRRGTTGAQWITGTLAVAALALSGCAQDAATAESDAASGGSSAAESSDSYFTTDRVHNIDVQFNQAEYDAMLNTYAQSGDKEWLSVTLTIDGTTFENVGLRLKGNRTLREMLAKDRNIQLSESDLASEESDTNEQTSSTDPASIPWLIRLNKFEDNQSYMGRYDFVVRSNNSESYLNEAVMMAMLTEADMPAEQVAFTSFSVNGSDPKLRLVIEVPDDELWNEDAFGDDGYTWKADADGDWDYHGTDGTAYESLWKQRTGEDNMTPIVEFMDFINNASDEEFESSLESKLDVEEFAKYLAIEDLFKNSDTISGPGNNGYLHYDPATGQMTVVAWDHDLGLGVDLGGGGQGAPGGSESMTPPEGMEPPQGAPGGGAGRTPPEGMTPPDGMTPPTGDDAQSGIGGPGMTRPEGMEPPQGGGQGGPGGGSNILETRFRASESFQKLYDQAYSDLKAKLITSGFAEETLNRYADLLTTEASNLISPQVVESDQATIQSFLNRDEAQTPPEN